MKKLILLLFVSICALNSYAQKGDLFVGGLGGYITSYKAPMYGLNVAYHLTDPLEISFTGLMNPNIKYKDEFDDESKIKMYSTNLDFRFYLILQRGWATGPTVGGQYSYIDKKYLNTSLNDEYKNNVAGFNLGWYLRINLTDNLKFNGGWRYTSANQNANHHLFHVGLGYTFNVF